MQFCQQKAIHPVSVERTSQLVSIQELVSLDHGISLIPAMARALDVSDRRVYRSLSDVKPTRRIVIAWNPYHFQSRLIEAFRQRLQRYVKSHDLHPRSFDER